MTPTVSRRQSVMAGLRLIFGFFAGLMTLIAFAGAASQPRGFAAAGTLVWAPLFMVIAYTQLSVRPGSPPWAATARNAILVALAVPASVLAAEFLINSLG